MRVLSHWISRDPVLTLLATLLLTVALGACQNPDEPNPTVANVSATVLVKDQGDNPVRNVKVYVNDPQSVRKLAGRTDEHGEVVVVRAVPLSGTVLAFDVADTLPNGADTILAGNQQYRIGCRDSLYTIIVSRRTIVSCSEPIVAGAESLVAAICTGSRVLYTRPISFACGFPVTLDVAPVSPGFANGTLIVRKNGQALPAGTSRVTLTQASDSFDLCFRYDAAASKASGSAAIGVTATILGGTPQPLLNVTLTGITSCDSCSCPIVNDISYPLTGPDRLCPGVPANVSIDLSSIVNTNRTCDVEAVVVSGPQSQAVQLVSFNGGVAILHPGDKLGRLQLSVTPPSAPGTYTDRVRFVVRTRTPDGGSIPCDTASVNYSYIVAGQSCPLQLSGDLIASQGPPVTTTTFQTSVCSSQNRTLCMKNTSNTCPIAITRMEITGTDAALFSIAPSGVPATIDAGQNKCFTVTFAPTLAAYHASGTPPRTAYTASLAVESACGVTTMNLTGQINDPKMVAPRLFPFTCAPDTSIGFVILPDGSVNSAQDPNGDFVVTVESIDLTAPRSASVRFKRPFKLVRSGVTSSSVCDQRFDPAVAAAFNSAAASAAPQTIHQGDLYVVSYDFGGCPFCALLLVESFDDPAPPLRNCPQVQFRVCSPIVF
ncbi:MAG: hypothetical protein JST22_21515 [Bacteroidetes bacterium]|nr:hypothetical protein [Bacteroidota bacterium]